VQNGFGNPNNCIVGQLTKEFKKKIGWMKRTIGRKERPKVENIDSCNIRG
jgi:hypothetical protein